MERTVLVVQNDGHERAALKDALIQCGLQVMESNSPGEAMSVVRGEHIDGLVITDESRQLALKGLCTLVKKSRPEAPVFVLLHQASDEARVSIAAGDGAILLPSDFSPEQIASRVIQQFGDVGPRIWAFEKMRWIRKSRLWEVHLARDLSGSGPSAGHHDGHTLPFPPAQAPRWVMLTQLAEAFAKDEDLRAEFTHAASLVSQLRHPNIPRLREFGGEHDIPFIATDYMNGGSLADAYNLFRQTGSWPSARLSGWIASEIAAAVEHAHAASIAHGAISPESVWLTFDGRVQLLYLGVAGHCAALERSMRASPGMSIANLYIAPEQIKHEHADAQTDAFLIGIVLNELLTKHPLALRDESAPRNRGRNETESIPEPLHQIAMACLQRNPSFRPESAAALRRALIQAGATIPPPSPAARWTPQQELAELMKPATLNP